MTHVMSCVKNAYQGNAASLSGPTLLLRSTVLRIHGLLYDINHLPLASINTILVLINHPLHHLAITLWMFQLVF
jgi:hypothetical protein